MSQITDDELKVRIKEILKVSDVSTVTSKKIREQIESELGYSLLKRKKEIDQIIMEELESDSESEPEKSDKSSEEEEIPKKTRASSTRKAPIKRKRKAKSGSGSDSDSDNNDEEYKAKKSKKKNATGAKRANGFTRPLTLSPELSAFMGEEAVPRHAVVKKVWAVIKERNLFDPKNKQFAICDDELMKIMKIKRFRTFGMLKYLKPHFIN